MSDRHVLPPYSLRMPEDLRGLLEAAAKQSKRSLNAEIVSRLEASFDPAALVDFASALQPDEKKDRFIQHEVADIKKQFGLFQEMLALLREPPTEEQIAWAQEKMAERQGEPLKLQKPPRKK